MNPKENDFHASQYICCSASDSRWLKVNADLDAGMRMARPMWQLRVPWIVLVMLTRKRTFVYWRCCSTLLFVSLSPRDTGFRVTSAMCSFIKYIEVEIRSVTKAFCVSRSFQFCDRGFLHPASEILLKLGSICNFFKSDCKMRVLYDMTGECDDALPVTSLLKLFYLLFQSFWLSQRLLL